MAYEDAEETVFFNLEKRRLTRDFVAVYRYLIRGYREDRANLFIELHSITMRPEWTQVGRLLFFFFLPRLLQYWNWLLRKAGISIPGSIHIAPDLVRPALSRKLYQKSWTSFINLILCSKS